MEQKYFVASNHNPNNRNVCTDQSNANIANYSSLPPPQSSPAFPYLCNVATLHYTLLHYRQHNCAVTHK